MQDSLTSNWSPKPAADEIEITLLGRGFGESVVLHLLDGDWVVIDSLFDKQKNSAPMEYLKSIGVSGEQVKIILATHFHDDHICGISQLYEWGTEADLAISFSKTARELSRYLEAHDLGSIGQVTSGADELSELMRLKQSMGRRAPIQCQAALPILKKASSSAGIDVTLTALSPSSADVEDFILRMGEAIVEATGIAKRLEKLEPNDISVAAWVGLGNEAILLGADLETKISEERGWKAVIASTTRPSGKASIYKVAHHGSENGDHPDIWEKMLDAKPTAVLTPFNKGKGIPKKADQARLLGNAGYAYITNATPFRKYQGSEPIVKKALEASGISIRSGNREVGRITLRKKINDENWDCNLENGADLLHKFVPRDL